mmetsp:Transcript_14833/g.39573  ORF Transcript_14833/g.39573 Transcript_14833/m.39573 type:complete len:280 (+) Transcript_14833:165-1004(+)
MGRRLREVLDVQEAVGLHADVHESSESHDVPQHAPQPHARLQVLHAEAALQGVHARPWVLGVRAQHAPQLWPRAARARVALARPAQLRHDVLQRLLSAAELAHVGQRTPAQPLAPRPEALAQRPCRRVALGVHGRGIQRLAATRDAQEAGHLPEGRVPEAPDAAEVLAALEGAIGCPMGDQRLAEAGLQPRDVAEKRRAGRVHVHADRAHALLDRASQLLLEDLQVHVVLVESDAQGLGVYLHQFGQGVQQPPRDRDRAAQCHVQAGQLRARQLRSGVD